MFVGVDIGGTFTDLVVSVDGKLRVHKLLSTPDDPAQAMLAGLADITPGGLSQLSQVAHGTTVATNAILERRGAKVALLTTAGYRDILAIGRQNRPDLYALYPAIPPPLVPRHLCFDVPERLDHHGNILTSLDPNALAVILETLAQHAIEAVAVSLLYSYINPIHELAIREAILAHGLVNPANIALSHEILPEFREYERTSTVVLEAYVRPVISRYLGNLTEKLPASTRLHVMKSDGGVVRAGRAASQAVHTALSGPAAGVIGAHHLARLAGYPNIITLDMGGTSTDVALMAGELERRPQSEIDGLPLRFRLLDIDTVGAGGGSIARLDTGGAMRVGPQSAGAKPGPVAYGYGGTTPTVTDANIVLGRIDPTHFLGGKLTLDDTRAQQALAQLGTSMGLTATQAAAGVIDIANVHIDRALRRVSVARGHDPRDFTLVAFGGAGPLHGCEVAERLGMRRVLIPQAPGVLCAFGLLVADVVLDYAQTFLVPVGAETYTTLQAAAEQLQAQAKQDLLQDGIPEAAQTYIVKLDARYQGQGYELSIPLERDIKAAFHTAHAEEYGYYLAERVVEVVNLRLTAVGAIHKPTIKPTPERGNPSNTALIRIREDGVSLYNRERLSVGATFTGEAIVFQLDSTIYIPPGWLARVDGYHNLIIEREGDEA